MIRLPKSDLYDDPIHNEPYLVWIQQQADRISQFSNVIVELKDDQKKRIISPMKVNETAAKFTEFYIKNIAFKSIYEEMSSIWEDKASTIYNEIYLDIKKEVTDYVSERGLKYKKKDATQAEIEREMATHSRYNEYKEAHTKELEYSKKAKTQDEYIKGLGKLDLILNLLYKSSQTEMKYLYLET